MMNIPMPRTRFHVRRAGAAPRTVAAPPYVAPAPKPSDAETLRRILREHAARWQ